MKELRKNVLIDSLYINNSGGFLLLDYLLHRLLLLDISFMLLADNRCQGRLDFCPHVVYMSASLKNRKQYYQQHKRHYSSVFCFGNIPAPIRMDVPVYTYFHNINLLTLAEANTVMKKVAGWLKREVFRHYRKNTDYWIVQTTNTARELKRHLYEKDERVRILPFYKLPDELLKQKDEEHGNDYVYVANYTGAKGHEELLTAWTLLHQKGMDKTLHLTVNINSPFSKRIEEAQARGVRVVNHGLVSFDEVIKLYKQSKAIIYSSHNESLGLGIIEAIEAGCDVIGADLPYIHAVCNPSGLFDPYSPESIAEAVEKYEDHKQHNSTLLINNMIDELINLITTS